MATAQFSNTTYGNAFVDALSSGYRFVPSGSDGAKPLITYYLNGAGWASNGAAQAFTAAVTAWSTVANISFQRVYSQTGATWTESLYSDGSDTLGAHYYPNNDGSGGEFNQGHSFFTYNMLGGVGFVTFLHEIGHGLGLDHPFETGANFPGVTAGDSSDQGDNNFANGFYTVMSYTDDPWFAVAPGYDYGYCATPMAFDIATIQRVYGANMSTATGNNVYTLPTGNAQGTFWSCIWDAGGTDTISGAANGAGVTIDLRAATLVNAEGGGGRPSWQSGTLGGSVIYGGFTIANGAVIENAVGSAYGDNLTGNAFANEISGGAGNDTIYALEGNDIIIGGGGVDTLNGGAGADRYVYATMTDASNSGTFEQIVGFEVGSDKIDFTVLALTSLSIVLSGANYHVSATSAAGTFTISVAANGTLTNADILGAPGAPVTYNVITGSNSAESITGTAAADEISGLGGNDTLNGAAGNDRLLGGDGNDVLIGNIGDDYMDGGAGSDLAVYSGASGAVTVNLGLTIAQATGGAGTDTLINVERLAGSNFADHLEGSAVSNIVYGGGGNDWIATYDGDDTVLGDAGNDTIYGGNGKDYLRGNDGNDVVWGEAGNDELRGEEGDDTLNSGDGDDVLIGANGNDLMDGGAGVDIAVYSGSSGAITVNLSLTAAQNTGGAGTDTLLNIENLSGSGFADRIEGNASANAIYAGAGNDWISGYAGNDTILGDAGDDYIYGGTDNDLLRGGVGSDALYGDVGNDTLRGEDGNDRLWGGAGTDTLFGGSGADLFNWHYVTDLSATRSTTDTVLDFNRTENDKLVISGIDAIAGSSSVNDAFSFIGASAFSNTAGQLRSYVENGVTWVEGDVNGDGIADLIIRLNGSHTLQASDFVL